MVTSASAEIIDLGSDQGWKEEIARLAYEFWLERGSPIGTPGDDWFRAQAEVRSRQSNPNAKAMSSDLVRAMRRTSPQIATLG